MGATAALTGFVVTVSVLVVQMATSMLSARYMRLWYRDRVLHILLAMLVGTFTFSFTLLAGVEENSVPHVGVTVTGVLMAADLFLFLFFLDRFVHRLRPVAVAAHRGGRGQAGIRVHRPGGELGPTRPRSCAGRWRSPASRRRSCARAARARSRRSTRTALVRFARQHRSTLVLNHAIGDFVPAGAAVIRVYGGEPTGDGDEDHLRRMIVLGVERTIEQDPAFAVRIMVDVAIKALSPAVNDPTTAVQVINHLGDLLHRIGATDFRAAAPAEPGTGRVLIAARGWEQYLALGVTEIRGYGASSVQVARRLRAMLEELHGAVLPEHRPAVEDELERLEAAVALALGTSPDLDRASEADKQGLGGAPRSLGRARPAPRRASGRSPRPRGPTSRRGTSELARACQSSPRTRIWPTGARAVGHLADRADQVLDPRLHLDAPHPALPVRDLDDAAREAHEPADHVPRVGEDEEEHECERDEHRVRSIIRRCDGRRHIIPSGR